MTAVSVILTVYNTEPFLRQCLDSILCQTFRDYELICVDDGSTDASPDILRAYAARDSRIRILTKPNEGLGAAPARNLGLREARGKYVSILDSDDFFAPRMLERAVARAEAADADFVILGGCQYDDRSGAYIPVTSILNEKALPEKEVFCWRDCPDSLYQISQGMAWNKLYRRSFLERSGVLFQRMKYTDDAYFTFAHMALAERIAAVPEALCCYRVNSGSSQTAGLADYPDSAYLPYTALKDSLTAWGVYEPLKRSFLNCATNFLRYFYDRIDRFDAFQYLHDKYRTEIFSALDISGQPEAMFDDRRTYLWKELVERHSAGEAAFQAMRGYGSLTNTAVLRFPFPYDRIPGGSRVALIGKGIEGRYLFAQALVSGYCEVAIWAEDADDLRDAAFDHVIIALSDRERIERITAALRERGLPEDRIIRGAEERQKTDITAGGAVP